MQWNAVLIDDNWRFMNSYWGACAVGSDAKGKAKTTFNSDESFFLMDPEHIAYTHYTDDPRWLLLDRRLSIAQFEKKAFLKERFFEMDMRVLSHSLCEIKCANGEVDMLFGVPEHRSPEYEFVAILSEFIGEEEALSAPIKIRETSDTQIDDTEDKAEEEKPKWKVHESDKYRSDFINLPNDTHVRFKVRLPSKGIYKLELLGKDNAVTVDNYDLDWLAIYKIKCTGTGKFPGFPLCDDAGWGPGHEYSKLDSLGIQPDGFDRGVVEAEGGYLDAAFKHIIPELAVGHKLAVKITHCACGIEEAEFQTDLVSARETEYCIFNDIPPAKEYAVCLYVEEKEEIITPVKGGEPHVEINLSWRNVCNYYMITTKMGKDSKFRDIEDTRICK